MKGVESCFEAPASDVSIAVGRPDILMPQHILDEAEIGAIFEEMGGK